MKVRVSFYIIFLFLTVRVLSEDKYQFSKLDITKGLSNNQVNCILRDSKGFMWFGTMAGLDRYDGSEFKVYKHNVNDSNSINDNFVFRIIEDYKGEIWIENRVSFTIYNPITESFSTQKPSYLKNLPFGLYNITNVYSDNNNNFWIMNNITGPYYSIKDSNKLKHFSHNPKDPQSISSNNISAINQDSKGNFWFINRLGIIEKIDAKTLKVKQSIYDIQRFYKGEAQDYILFIDSDDDLWICGTNIPQGVFWYNTSQNRMKYLNKDSGLCRLNNNLTRNFAQDKNGYIWIGTDHGGINVYDKKKNTIQYLTENSDDEKSLSQNSITYLYKDNTGIIWVSTFKKGINYYHENLLRFKLIKHEPENLNSLQFDDVDCFAEDKLGNLWIGTNGGGLIYFDRKNNKFIQYKHIPGNPNSISNDIIVKLFIDSHNILWIGTYFGGLNKFDGKTFKCYKHNPLDNTTITDDRIWEIKETPKGDLWIGTLGGGLDLFDPHENGKDIFYHYKAEDANSINNNFVISMTYDLLGNLWIGTSIGLDVLDIHSNRFTNIKHENNVPLSLSNDNVICTYTDSRGLIWVGTRDGLNVFDENKNLIKIFTEDNGLSENTIASITEDKVNNIWVGTHNGLSNIIISKDTKNKKYNFSFKNYNQTDGLQGKEFNERSAFTTSKGEVLFGGPNGINLFEPQKFAINYDIPKIVFTSFQIFNNEVIIGKKINGRIVLDKSITATKSITLKSSENVFSIGFSALNYLHPEKNKYVYKLEGFNLGWLSLNNKNQKVTYTNLDPGEYIFRVRASNDDGIWNNKGANLKIIILPPFWRTKLALLIYIAIIIISLLIARKLTLSQARLKFQLEQERYEKQRVHDLDMLKIKFFTNISHEFRTPLSLILAPIEKLISTSENADQKKHFVIIQRNAKRLLNLVNQLLDFRRMEEKEFKLNPVSSNIVEFIKDVVYSFSDISEKKNINLTFQSNVKEFIMQFDADKFEKIMYNLLSNAFKFTHENGNVDVEINVDHLPDNMNKYIEIKVKDTGIGIPANMQENIFEQFFQNEVPGNMINQGSGIGLSITKEFVRLHNGTIKVISSPDIGSCFTISIPINEISVLNNDIIERQEIYHAHELLQNEPENLSSEKPLVLIVEDNEDLRFYLKDNLKRNYSIIEAGNGKDALNKAFLHIPEIIVSDIMMPEMNGIELCTKLKNDKRTSHIPIILLTAKSEQEHQLEGYNSGAADYIIKPFNFEILESKLKNIISQREGIRKSFQRYISVNPSEIKVESIDEKLIQKALEIVEKNISNSEFLVEDLSRELGMSRVNLYKKLLSITGKTPIEFIRTIRLKRAAQLLKGNGLSVSEVAFKVGFNNPKYFTKYFKEEFDVLPSQYLSSLKNDEI
jgi:signal transduction histidine kinase/ligand-binding sensor domain-containing protein/DNA-binding response OmpR family regulator